MARALPEWIGKSDDTPIPPRVRLRVFQRDHGVCQCGCTRVIRPGNAWQTDHRIALINGGENRENNLYTLLVDCHIAKTKTDTAEKAKTYAKQKVHLGLKPKSQWAYGRGSPWKKKINGQVVRR